MIKVTENAVRELTLKTKLHGVRYDQRNGLGASEYNSNDPLYWGPIAIMRPSSFLGLAERLEHPRKGVVEGIVGKMETGAAVASPYLKMKFTRSGFYVIGHEGRHRCMAIQKLFGDDIPIIVMLPNMGGDYGQRARSLDEHILSHLNKMIKGESGSTGARNYPIVQRLFWRNDKRETYRIF